MYDSAFALGDVGMLIARFPTELTVASIDDSGGKRKRVQTGVGEHILWGSERRNRIA